MDMFIPVAHATRKDFLARHMKSVGTGHTRDFGNVVGLYAGTDQDRRSAGEDAICFR